jgi:hypothetical protein
MLDQRTNFHIWFDHYDTGEHVSLIIFLVFYNRNNNIDNSQIF